MNGRPQPDSGRRLAEAIKARSLTNSQVAEKLGVSVRSVTGWRSGERGPKVTEAQALAELLGQPALPSWWDWPSTVATPLAAETNDAQLLSNDEALMEDNSSGDGSPLDDRRSPVLEATPDHRPPGRIPRAGRRRLAASTALIGAAAITVGGLVVGLPRLHRPPAPAAPPGSAAPARGVEEFGGNRNGSAVFSSPAGAPVTDPELAVVPFGTSVMVACYSPDQSGMESVTGFYLVDGGPWSGLWVVSDTMTNGGALGDRTTPNVDPRVPAC